MTKNKPLVSNLKELTKHEIIRQHRKIVNKLQKRIDYLEGKEYYDSIVKIIKKDCGVKK